ncbi:MAG: hypothetical protein MTP17_01030 [Candidatus Midichloria sp.]|nr:MAG: hypothetical protein MTP17_01030 [Candidatus Midichloria sp.]
MKRFSLNYFKKTEVNFSVVSQEKEEILILEAAKMYLPKKRNNINDETIIFDSGGRSFQLPRFNKQDVYSLSGFVQYSIKRNLNFKKIP